MTYKFVESLKAIHNKLYILGARWYEYRQEWFKSSSESTVPPRVLDAGCGDAWVKKEFDKRNLPLEYHGIDIAVGDKNLEYLMTALADLHYIPYKSNTFDKVFSNSVLEHVENPARVMEEMSRVLVPGGRMYLSLPFLFHLHQIPYDYHRFTKFVIQLYAKKYNLKIVHLWPQGGFFTLLRYLLTNYGLISINNNLVWKIIFTPITMVLKLLDRTILAPIFYLLDHLDTNRNLCLGHFVVYEKMTGEIRADHGSNHYRCPYCQNDKAEIINSNQIFECNTCKTIFPTTGNIPNFVTDPTIKPVTNRLVKI
jgi:SAM-dependent methyltransferase/uncharacterized protein YbaR (Trm112 family)